MSNPENNNSKIEELEDINQAIHDIRTPLNRISMQAELIKLILEQSLPKEKAIDAANSILEATKDCSDLLVKISKK